MSDDGCAGRWFDVSPSVRELLDSRPMHFGDLKNDFLFRKIFAHHPHLTRALLNDVLGLEGEQRIDVLTILSPDQAPDIPGHKLSILDVKCRDHAGRWFVVEMQMIHIAGFLNRIVYNACKTYVAQLSAGAPFTDLANVVALSICNFELWPDAPRLAAGLAPVPLISHWTPRERNSGAADLGQIQYSFVELPKVPMNTVLTSVAEQWAWLFRVGAHEGDIPSVATPEQQLALQMANESTWTQGELEAYERVQQEIAQARQLAVDAEKRGLAEGMAVGKAEGRAEGRAEGLREGEALGLRAAIMSVSELLGMSLDDERVARLNALDAEALAELLAAIKRDRRWPG